MIRKILALIGFGSFFAIRLVQANTPLTDFFAWYAAHGERSFQHIIFGRNYIETDDEGLPTDKRHAYYTIPGTGIAAMVPKYIHPDVLGASPTRIVETHSTIIDEEQSVQLVKTAMILKLNQGQWTPLVNLGTSDHNEGSWTQITFSRFPAHWQGFEGARHQTQNLRGLFGNLVNHSTHLQENVLDNDQELRVEDLLTELLSSVFIRPIVPNERLVQYGEDSRVWTKLRLVRQYDTIGRLSEVRAALHRHFGLENASDGVELVKSVPMVEQTQLPRFIGKAWPCGHFLEEISAHERSKTE